MTSPPPPTLDASLPEGSRLGKYEILGRTAQGGMALVYRARDTLLDRVVAIKQIAPHLAEDPRWADRFRREAQTIARLAAGSRHIVQIHELVEEPRGLFIVMEFVEGHTLETLIREDQIDLQAALDILGGVCLGLRAVHAAGIVHRDIKPANIIVPPDRRAKITDFGVAAHAGGDSSMALGTTKYMAPELFGAGTVDGRADIYSLGFVAFEMFAGRATMDRLFAHLLTDERSAALRWMNWHLRMDQHLPRIDAVNPMIPPSLAEIVVQMAAKSLNVRYADINAVITDLKRNFTPAGAAQTASAQCPVPSAQTEAGRDVGRVSRPDGSSAPHAAPPMKVGTSTITAPPGVFESDAPTAPLVKPGAGKKIRRGPLVAACVGAAGCIVLIALSLSRGPDQLAEMQQLFDDGRSAYQARHYDDALAKWRDAEKKEAVGRRAEEGRKAIAQWLPLAEAQIAMTRKDFGSAAAKISEAEKRGAGRQTIATLRETLAKVQAGQEARDRFDRLLADGDLEQAGLLLRDVEDRYLLQPAALSELKDRLEQGRNSSTYVRQMRDAKQALEREEFDRALQLAQQAEAQQPTDQVKALIKQINATRTYKQAVKAGDEALAVGDFRSAADHYAAANHAQPTPIGEKRLKHAKALEQVAAAQTARRDGKLREARDAFEQALKFEELPEARRELTALTTLLVVREKIDAGQHAADAGDWDAALKTWQEALAGSAADQQDELQAKITLAQVQVAVTRGERLADQKKWDEAKTAFEEAIRLGGGDEVKRRLQRVETDRSVEELLDRGDKARDAGQYSEAMKHYRKAMELREKGDPQIQKHIDEVNYRQFKESGTRKFREGQFRAALADLRQALRLHPDDKEVARLIAEAQKKGG